MGVKVPTGDAPALNVTAAVRKLLFTPLVLPVILAIRILEMMGMIKPLAIVTGAVNDAPGLTVDDAFVAKSKDAVSVADTDT